MVRDQVSHPWTWRFQRRPLWPIIAVLVWVLFFCQCSVHEIDRWVIVMVSWTARRCGGTSIPASLVQFCSLKRFSWTRFIVSDNIVLDHRSVWTNEVWFPLDWIHLAVDRIQWRDTEVLRAVTMKSITVWGRSSPTFRKNILSPCSELKIKARKWPARIRQLWLLSAYCWLLSRHISRLRTWRKFLRNVVWTDCSASHPHDTRGTQNIAGFLKDCRRKASEILHKSFLRGTRHVTWWISVTFLLYRLPRQVSSS